jgi:uncharacterized protein (TIGR03437 family)
MKSFVFIGTIFCFAASLGSAANCSATTTGLKPLNTPFFTNYKGFAGGLYPNSNQRPAAHGAAGLAQAALVRPRDLAGNIDEQNGRLVLLSIGMSNTTQEFSAFQRLVSSDPERNPKLVLVDGAQGGWSADRIVADPDDYWKGVEQRIQTARLTDAQIQTAWVKLADMGPTLPFPADARKLESETQKIIEMAKTRFPNLRLVYLSSRIYAGYATTPLNPEPYAYQGGFSVKWLIQAQLEGDPALDFASGKFPWLSWGPYLWGDGTTLRFDGLTWNCSDLAEDGTHPSESGQIKVATILLDFFKGDATTRPWFVVPSKATTGPSLKDAVNAAGFFPTIAPGAIASLFGSDLAGSTVAAKAFPLPYGLAGTTIEVGGEPAPLYFVSPGQINFIVPPGANSNTIAVNRESAGRSETTVQIALNSEGLFAVGPGQNAAALHQDGTAISPQSPAHPGETIQLFGTGKGVRNPAILAPEILPTVEIGGRRAQVQFFGPAPIYPGLDQLNVTVPGDVPPGSPVPLTIHTAVTNTVNIAIGPGT